LDIDTLQTVEVLIIVLIIVFLITLIYIRYGHRKNPSMERRILDALEEYGCIENPPFTPRTATAREVAHSIFNMNEYIKNPDLNDLRTASYLIQMEYFGDLGNCGETTIKPELAVIKGRWYIKWHSPPSD
jgi:hypothetical protein